MRILLALTGIIALAWGGYWFIGAASMERAIVGWMDERRDDGWLADAANVKTRGFPNRFDTTLTGVQLADPETGIAWTAPFFQILSLSYRPNHIIAVFPKTHSYSTPMETIEISANETQGSVIFEPNTNLTLDRTSFVIEKLGLVSNADWSLEAEGFQFATRQTAALELAHDLSISARGVSPGGSWQSLVKEYSLPPTLDTLKLDATAGFDAPWDRFAIEKKRPQPTLIDVRDFKIEWGELLFMANGKLDVDRNGTPTGKISVQARNWREMLAIFVQAGAIPVELAPTLEGGLSLLASLSGNANYIDATLTLKNGYVSVGPIPIGPAPSLKLR